MGEAGAQDLKAAAAGAARSWSLARRLRTLFLVSTTAFVVLISAISAFSLIRAAETALENLVNEELDEMSAYLEPTSEPLSTDRPDNEKFWQKRAEGIPTEVNSLAEKHASKEHFAWRIWSPGSETYKDFGETQLLTAEVPATWPEESVGVLPQGLRWTARATKPSNWRILFVLDTTAVRKESRDYIRWAMFVVLAIFGLAWVFSHFFFARVSRLLGQVAERAREVRSIDEPLSIQVDHAPVEIAAIAEALSEMLEKVRKETTQARIFTAGLAHELRSPVQNLVGETEVALLRERDNETYRKVLASHLEELRSLGDAIDNLVTICSAGDTGRTHPRELIDLGEESKIRLARERTQGARHQVQLELGIEGDTRIWCDREALLRAIRNLVANAVQWSPPGSKVVARVRGMPQEIEVVVDDAGPGVPPELRERIFEPFFRGPQASGRRIGYGLGLALTRMAVDEHAGRIEVGESPLGGARFRVLLPRRAPLAEGLSDRSTDLTS